MRLKEMSLEKRRQELGYGSSLQISEKSILQKFRTYPLQLQSAVFGIKE